jgi:hypothetical protein
MRARARFVEHRLSQPQPRRQRSGSQAKGAGMTLQLSDQQKSYLTNLANDLPAAKRDTFWGALQFRLGGRPSDETLKRAASLIYRELQRNEIIARRA